ncbi:oxidoreductase, partial [Chloroflexota bacterium]
CGPPLMYKFVILALYKMGLADKGIFVSLERNMKCGVGKCGHCQINHLYVCQDGPVFKWADISEVQEAIA